MDDIIFFSDSNVRYTRTPQNEYSMKRKGSNRRQPLKRFVYLSREAAKQVINDYRSGKETFAANDFFRMMPYDRDGGFLLIEETDGAYKLSTRIKGRSPRFTGQNSLEDEIVNLVLNGNNGDSDLEDSGIRLANPDNYDPNEDTKVE